MNLRSLLHRRRPDRVPPLPLIGPDDRRSVDPAAAPPTTAAPRTAPLTDEERLERLLTPTELALVLEHRMTLDPESASARPHDSALP
ncbi:hypothetical protein [Nocardia shimofusensis]|uniref:hypothetical protein n=1 Tax=Nocardia shimofusensis TaxID=228596 RepID=UPI00083703F3|nr:hypothetical protein [Nocardia shimofusensis]